MRIALDLNSRDHATGVRDLLAASRIAHADHGGPDCGKVPKLQRLQPVEEGRVVHFKKGEIAIMPDVRNPRLEGAGILIAAHKDLPGPRDHMRIGHDATSLDHKAGPPGASDRVEPPRCIKDGRLAEGQDLDDRTFRRPGPQGCGRDQAQNEKQPEAHDVESVGGAGAGQACAPESAGWRAGQHDPPQRERPGVRPSHAPRSPVASR